MAAESYTILLVDDFPVIIESIVSFFEDTEYPYTFLEATNAEAAIKIAQIAKPDLILMDWEMPRINGVQAVKIIKSMPELADIPIVMASGVMLSSENLSTALEAGAVDFIRKPIDKIEMISRINSALALSQSMKKLKFQSQKLFEAANTLQQLADATLEGIIIHKDFQIIEANKQACNMLGYLKEELFETSLSYIIERNRIPEFSKHVFHNNEFVFETEIVTKAGTVIQIQALSKGMTFNDEQVRSFAFVDISQVKQQQIRILEQEKAIAENEHRNLQTKLHEADKKITENALLNAHFNEKLKAVLDEVKVSMGKTGKELKMALHDIVSKYRSEINDSYWHEFELRFSEVHPDFYRNIKTKHPQLTPGEIRLCSLLKLNMVSKEIASLTQLSPQSINVARSRIRKKMNLENDDNLVNYLSML